MSKIRFRLNDVEFVVSNKTLERRNDGTTRIYLNAKNTASVIKQYVKKTYPDVKCWATSQVFAGGNSVDVYISHPNGHPVSDVIYNIIFDFTQTLRSGSFNGMYDIYEYREDEVKTDNGTVISFGAKYVSVDNRPKWGTAEQKGYDEFVRTKYTVNQ